MRKDIEVPDLGKVSIYQSSWTGRFRVVTAKGAARRGGKRTFYIPNPNPEKPEIILNIDGSDFKGYGAVVNGKYYHLIDGIPWYCYVLVVFGFTLWMTLSMIPSVVSVLPLVGGAIGGAIGGVMAGLYLYVMRTFSKPWARALIYLPFFAADFGLRLGIALIILAS